MAVGNNCLLARAKLAQYVSSLKESSFAEKAGTAIKAGYLASPKTFERNLLGNAAFGGVEYLGTKPIASAVDYLTSVAKSAATFGKIAPHEFRQLANTLSPAGFRAGVRGITEGVAQGVNLLKTGIDPEHLAQKFEVGETTFQNPTIDKAVKGVFNVMEAADKPYFQFAFRTSLYGRAKLFAIRAGLKGAAMTEEINSRLANPSEEMILGAMNDAQYATFKNATVLSDLAAGVRNTARRKLAQAGPGSRVPWAAANIGLDLTIPFTKVASAIANAGIDYSPAGFAKALIQAADKDPKVQGQLAQQFARASIGTALTAAGYAMAKSGNLTGSFPSKQGDRAQWEVENTQANSVRIGGKWRSITSLGPLAIPMLLGAGLYHFGVEKPDAGLGEQAAFGAGSIGKTMTEQSYLQGLSNVIDALNDPANRGANAVAGMIPIPAIVGQAAQAIDPTVRKTSSIAEKIQARIPGASQGLPAKLTQFGDTVKRGSPFETVFDISNPRADQSDATTNEMDRVGAHVNTFGKQVKLPDGTTAVRTPEQYNALLQEFGPIKRGLLAAILESPAYRAAPDDAKGDVLRTLLQSVQRTGNTVDKARRLGQPVPRTTLRDFLGETP